MPFTRIRKENDNNKIQKETDKVTDMENHRERRKRVLNVMAILYKYFFLPHYGVIGHLISIGKNQIVRKDIESGG